MIGWVTLFIDRPTTGFDNVSKFWLAATGTAPSSTRGDQGEFATLLPSHGDAFMRIQRTVDGSAGSHIDLHVDDVLATAERAVRLGATVVTGAAARDGLVVMRSPGGLGFCVVARRGEPERPVAVGPSGARTLVDQVSLDIAPDRFDEECRFWAGLTDWELRPGAEPEYAVLARPEGQPIRFLLQRRGDGDLGLDAEAHIDFACDDVDASVVEHVELGATIVERFRWWVVMSDPAGVRYCLTRRNPDTGVPV